MPSPDSNGTSAGSVVNGVKLKDNNGTNRVSFRKDVAFDNTGAAGVSARSGISSDGDSAASETSAMKQSYSKLRSKLTREQLNRDPFFFYQVTRNLGEGSMGDVKLVKKRADKVGGSARRDIQEAVRRQRERTACFQVPIIGNIFRMCVDGDLKDEPMTDSDPSSRHSAFSFLSGKDDTSTTQTTGVSAARSFEDSLSSDSSSSGEIIYAMKSILLHQIGDQTYIDELRNEIAILKDLDHPNIVRAIETFEFHGKISIVMEVWYVRGAESHTIDTTQKYRIMHTHYSRFTSVPGATCMRVTPTPRPKRRAF